MERISGPYHGYYLAAYTVRWESGYLGFAKICTGEPDDVWMCRAIEKVGEGPMASAHQALVAAEEKARLYIRWRGAFQTPPPVVAACGPRGGVRNWWATAPLPWRKARRCPT